MFPFLLPVLNLEYLHDLLRAPQWNATWCHKFNSEAVFPDYFTKYLPWINNLVHTDEEQLQCPCTVNFQKSGLWKSHTSQQFLGQGPVLLFVTNATHWDIREMLRTQAKPNNMNTSKTQLHLYKNWDRLFFSHLGEGCRIVDPHRPSSIRVTFAAWLPEPQVFQLLSFPLQMRYWSAWQSCDRDVENITQLNHFSSDQVVWSWFKYAT